MLAWIWLAGCTPDADADADGVSVKEGDCADDDPYRAPGVAELCDGIDQDCDDRIDEDPRNAETWTPDLDLDGFGDDDQAVAGCTGPEGWVSEGGDCDDENPSWNPEAVDTEDEDRDCSGDVAKDYHGAVTIELATVTCTGTEVLYLAETIGVTTEAKVFAQQTGATGTQWADEHQLESTDHASNDTWDHLERELDDGDTLADPTNDWVENESTAFTCAGDFAVPDQVTVAFVVYDEDGDYADCVVIGGDWQGLVDGTWDRIREPTFPVDDCHEGVFTR